MSAGRVYLSGPISLGGTLRYDQITDNIARFNAAAAALRAAGHTVVNPVDVGGDDQPGHARQTWHHYMVLNLKALLDCDGIMMLPGWETSRGARIERQLAEDLGLQVSYWQRVPA